MRRKDDSLVRPKRLEKWRAKRVIYIPCDLPSGIIAARLRHLATFQKDLGFGRMFRVGGQIAVYGALGAPAAALALEPLIAGGAKDIVLLGFCGSLDEEFSIGDLASISLGFSDEGTSHHYLPGQESFSPAAGLKKEIEDSLRSAGVAFRTGKIVSTDAPFRETRLWLERSRGRGAELVDMETAAVFALARYRGIRAASLQIVSDELASGRWRSGFSDRRLDGRVRDAFFPFLSG